MDLLYFYIAHQLDILSSFRAEALPTLVKTRSSNHRIFFCHQRLDSSRQRAGKLTLACMYLEYFQNVLSLQYAPSNSRGVVGAVRKSGILKWASSAAHMEGLFRVSLNLAVACRIFCNRQCEACKCQ